MFIMCFTNLSVNMLLDPSEQLRSLLKVLCYVAYKRLCSFDTGFVRFDCSCIVVNLSHY